MEWFKTALVSKAETAAQDVELSQAETQALQTVFSNLLAEKLKNWKEIDVPPNRKVTFEGKDYEIYVSPARALDFDIYDFYCIYKLCEECLVAAKPMYLTVD